MSQSEEKCTVCQSNVPLCDGVFLTIKGNSRFHCKRRYNRRLSEMAEVQFDHPDFQRVTLKDFDGKPHELQFSTRLLPRGISIHALEIQKGRPQGYQFQVRGPLEGTPQAAREGSSTGRGRRFSSAPFSTGRYRWGSAHKPFWPPVKPVFAVVSPEGRHPLPQIAPDRR